MKQNKDSKSTIGSVLTGYEGPVRIGAKDGSGFIYCGNLADMNPNDIDDEITGRWADLVTFNERTVANYSKAGAPFRTYTADMVRDAQSTGQDELPEFSLAKYLAYVEYQYSKLRKAYKRLRDLQRFQATAKPIMKREVVETYESVGETDVLIIIVEGHEICEAWDASEYNKPEAAAKRTQYRASGRRVKRAKGA